MHISYYPTVFIFVFFYFPINTYVVKEKKIEKNKKKQVNTKGQHPYVLGSKKNIRILALPIIILPVI